MADSEVKVVISGDSTTAQSAMSQASAAVRKGVEEMKSSVSGLAEAFSGLSEAFVAMGAILAGGAIFKEIISDTKEWTAEALQLGKALGISASQASIFNVAIEGVGGTSDDFASASRGLTRQLKANEKGLNDMGIATRDSAGNLKDAQSIMFDAITTVNSYAEGTDRNLAAQTAFGRGANANSAVLRLNQEQMAEAAETADQLGLIIGTQNVAAYLENRKATADAMDTLKGLGKVIGDALLPILTQLAEWFRSIGPAAIIVIKGAIALLLTPIWGLINGLNILFDIAQGVFNTLATLITGVAEAVYDAVHGNMSKAQNDLKAIGTGIQKNWKDAWNNIVSDSTKAHDAITNLFSAQDPAPAPGAGKKFNLKEKTGGPDNRLAQYKNELAEQEQAKGDYDQKDYAADLAFWQQKLALTGTSTKEDLKLREAISKEILGITKKQHDEQLKGEQEYNKTVEALELGQVAAAQQDAQTQLALGNITNEQMLLLEKKFEDQKFAIKQKAIQDQLALNQFDMLGQQKLKDQELLLEQQHQAAIQKIDDKAALQQQKVYQNLFKSMESGFTQTIAGFLKGTTSLGGAVKGLFQDITQSVIQSLAQMAAKNLEVMLASLVMNKTAAMGQIKANAAAGASAAYQAVVGIPYVGPFLAPAAAAVAYAGILAFGSNVASAAGGYDIPGGVNPITQLHQNEMVLPAKYANVIRGMAGGSGGGAGGNTYISAVDARSLQRVLTRGGGSSPLAKSVRRLNKGFVSG